MPKKFNFLGELVELLLIKQIRIFRSKLFSFSSHSTLHIFILQQEIEILNLLVILILFELTKMENKSNATYKFQWNNGYFIGIGIVAGLYGLWCLAGYSARAGVQQLNYKILSKLKSRKSRQTVQIRQYPPFLVAEATYPQSQMRHAMNSGFKDIAGFIFGNNTSKHDNKPEKIAMTSPVTVNKTSEENGYTICFVMPSKYTKQSLPKPNNDKVQIKQKPGQLMASISWRGNIPGPKTVEQKEKELREILAQYNYKPRGRVYLYEYDPPFTPGWMRINEALLEIDQRSETKI